MIRQLFIVSPFEEPGDIKFERKLYGVRRKIEKAIKSVTFENNESYYVVSFSARTIVYKGLLLPEQLGDYYVDLNNELYESAMAMVHNRFSTNTFPSWERAHPNRYLIHNGEINTLRGNINWMKAREQHCIRKPSGRIKALPILDTNGSDSSTLDNALEFCPSWPQTAHAAMMLIPEPWSNHKSSFKRKKLSMNIIAV